ncbi:hypothetical protein [Halovivax limisalsi]|uniref:hypothetical protein n=1 Tax=Halovivax limisalsi TaxID=1453760 RepID=UPI001FFD824B|nr:hypothetical protein [Halovivax limisalsi]
MGDRSLGHRGLCLFVSGAGLYVVANALLQVTGAPTAGGIASYPWLVAIVGLAIVTAGVGLAAAAGLWNRSPTGRRLGYVFVLAWVLLEAITLWGWLAGPWIAVEVVGGPMAPLLRLWIALSVGLYLWGWADGYVDRPASADVG